MVAGNGRKISAARTVTANAAGAPTRATVARNSELKTVLTILQSNRMYRVSIAERMPATGGTRRRRGLFPLINRCRRAMSRHPPTRTGNVRSAGAASEEGQMGAGPQVIAPTVPGTGDATVAPPGRHRWGCRGDGSGSRRRPARRRGRTPRSRCSPIAHRPAAVGRDLWLAHANRQVTGAASVAAARAASPRMWRDAGASPRSGPPGPPGPR